MLLQHEGRVGGPAPVEAPGLRRVVASTPAVLGAVVDVVMLGQVKDPEGLLVPPHLRAGAGLRSALATHGTSVALLDAAVALQVATALVCLLSQATKWPRRRRAGVVPRLPPSMLASPLIGRHDGGWPLLLRPFSCCQELTPTPRRLRARTRSPEVGPTVGPGTRRWWPTRD